MAFNKLGLKSYDRGMKMDNLKFIYDYKQVDKYRLSFNELAHSTFGIDFEKWYQKGLWNDRYICYSYIDGDRVVSNISVNTIEIILDGKRKKAVQIGTVMTHLNYRHRGLAASLMNIALREYESKCEFIYLFPNAEVLDFYHKFGFRPLQESQFSKTVSITEAKNMIRKLDIANEEDLNIITKLSLERVPISNIFGVDKAEHILTWYAVNVFSDSIYYLEDKDIVVIFDLEGETLNLYDVISRDKVDFDKVLKRIAASDTKKVIYNFTPELKDIEEQYRIEDLNNLMYVKGNASSIPENFKHPITAHA
jgi:predicted N-acetyltransferase YhbS